MPAEVINMYPTQVDPPPPVQAFQAPPQEPVVRVYNVNTEPEPQKPPVAVAKQPHDARWSTSAGIGIGVGICCAVLLIFLVPILVWGFSTHWRFLEKCESNWYHGEHQHGDDQCYRLFGSKDVDRAHRTCDVIEDARLADISTDEKRLLHDIKEHYLDELERHNTTEIWMGSDCRYIDLGINGPYPESKWDCANEGCTHACYNKNCRCKGTKRGVLCSKR